MAVVMIILIRMNTEYFWLEHELHENLKTFSTEKIHLNLWVLPFSSTPNYYNTVPRDSKPWLPVGPELY